MPSLGNLALRYLIWLIALRVLYSLAVNFLSFPNTLATTVILASIPAMYIARVALQQARARLDLLAWAKIWGVLISVYLILQVIVPAIVIPSFRRVFASADGVQVIATNAAAVAAMLALFLWIGSRLAPER